MSESRIPCPPPAPPNVHRDAFTLGDKIIFYGAFVTLILVGVATVIVKLAFQRHSIP